MADEKKSPLSQVERIADEVAKGNEGKPAFENPFVKANPLSMSNATEEITIEAPKSHGTGNNPKPAATTKSNKPPLR